MNRQLIISLCLLCAILIGTIFAQKIVTDRPVIGIIMHPETEASTAYPTRQYVAASYVKWIESSGGRVVLIPHTMPQDEIKRLLRQLNGLVFTGGSFIYPDMMDAVLDEVVAINESGTYFPVWGTCLGFQWLGIYFSGNRHLLAAYPASDVPMQLDFVPTANQTSFFNSMSNDLKSIFADKNLKVTMNNHSWGIGVESFNKELSGKFNLISTNVATDGGVFVSTMQHRKYPIFAAQWHPEKNNFEFGVDANGVPHSTTMHTLESVTAAQYCSNFFVQEARKCPQSFADWKELQARLTYSYPKYRGNTGSFVEKYWVDQGQAIY